MLGCALGGCGHDQRLQDLESDPMGSATFPGTSLAYEAKTESGTSLGKPVHAKITRRFSLDEATAQGAVADAAEQATTAGWTQVRWRGKTSFSTTKLIGNTAAELLVTVALFEGEQALFVYLTAN
jgi:hypothetical protein